MKLLVKPQILFMLCLTIGLTIFEYGCYRQAYVVKFFSYPPNSKPHEENWEYQGSLEITSREKGSFSKKSHKIIKINVKDKEKKNYLFDELNFYCSGIDAVIEWDHFENLSIILLEVGNKFADDQYNKQLIEKGPKRLIHLSYSFDRSLNRFIRIKTIN